MSSAELVKEHREEEEGAPAGEDEDTGAQVAPIVKLEEVAVTTGEEDEDLILDLKAKLYRFDKEVNQWKERGAGTVKFLKHKETKKVRLVMRQSKTLKICANHLILPTMTVQEHAGNEKSCLWHAKDFADGELKDELFCIRFASLEITERSRLSLSLLSSLYHTERDCGSIFRFLEDSITPSIPKRNASTISTRGSLKEPVAVRSEAVGSGGGGSTPCRRRLRSDRTAVLESSSGYLITRKSPRQCINSSPNTRIGGLEEDSDKIMKSCKSPMKRLSYSFAAKQPWNPKDPQHMSAVKEALHVSTVPCSIVCREDEQQRILEFCKGCMEQEKAGSLYICGCPGTGKSLSMEKVKQNLLEWAQDAGLQPPDVLSVQCTSLATTSEIFSKILGKIHLAGRANISTSSLQHLQKMYTQKQSSSGGMMLIIADELDYLITKDRAVLHDLFMLTALPFSRCILIGIANAIDLADRFLPTLQSLNCKPLVLTFRAYSKDQILQILQERLMALPYVVFEPQALELCARKIAAASGDMRKALCICRSAIDLVEAEAKETAREQNSQLVDNPETSIVKIDHMAFALSRTFRSQAVDTIQSLPQHQQITICSTMKLLRRRKKDATLGELYKSYLEVCKESPIPAIGIQEFSSICQVLNDQGLLKLGQSRNDKLRKIALKVEEADIVFALQGVRFFRNCLQQLQ